jgi:CheY-like chemotaxis protein
MTRGVEERVTHMTGANAAQLTSDGTHIQRRSSRPVLVIDDEPHILAFVRLALEDEGFAVVTAADGAAALTVLERECPCAILLDLQMPGMDGHAFLKEYRRRQDEARAAGSAPIEAPIIVFTASRVPLEAADAFGVESILRKPFDVEALLERVALHVTRAQQEHAN